MESELRRKVRREYYTDILYCSFLSASSTLSVSSPSCTLLLPMQVRIVECMKAVPPHHHTCKHAHHTWYVDQCLGGLGLVYTSRVLSSSSVHVCSLCSPIHSHPLSSTLDHSHPLPIHHHPQYPPTELSTVAAPHTFHSTILIPPSLPSSPSVSHPLSPSYPPALAPTLSERRCHTGGTYSTLQTLLVLSTRNGYATHRSSNSAMHRAPNPCTRRHAQLILLIPEKLGERGLRR